MAGAFDQSMGESLGIQVVSAFGIKGGAGKSTLSLALAAAIKRLHPKAKVGLIDMTTEQGTLSARFGPEMEAKGLGWWGIVRALLDDTLREENPNALADSINKAVIPLMVIPDAKTEEQGIIEFIGCGKRHLRIYETVAEVAGPEGYRTASKVLTHLERQRGWDFAVVDLPPSTKEVGSRMILPCAAAVAVVASATHEDDHSGYPAFLETLKGMEITPVGFLVNRIEEDSSSRDAVAALDQIAKAKKIPVLGHIKQRSTIKRSRETAPYDGATAKVRTGLYWAAANDRSTKATRAVAERSIEEIEAVTRKVLEAIQ